MQNIPPIHDHRKPIEGKPEDMPKDLDFQIVSDIFKQLSYPLVLAHKAQISEQRFK